MKFKKQTIWKQSKMKVALVLFTSCVVWFNDVSGQSSVGPNVACTDDSSCSSYSGTYCGGYSQCKKCVCPSTGYVYVESDMACLAAAKIGEACTSDKQCPDKQGGTTAGGSCTSSKCECDSGYLASSDQTSCHLPYPTEDCTTNPGCNTPSVVDCTDSKCVCKSGYVVDSTKTTCRVPTLGEACATTPGCSPTDSTCSSGTCACSTGYVKDSNTNTCRVPTLGETCASTPGCSPTDSTCSSGTCACSTGYVQDSSTCRKPYIDEACTTATGCIDTNSMDCTSQKCVCKDTHPTVNSDKKSCRQKYIDESCTGNNVCLSSITGATCTNDVCTCPTTSAGPATDKQSCKAQELDGTCKLSDDCIQPSTMVCDGGPPTVCGCPADYQAEGTTECRLPKYGEACQSGATAVKCNVAADPNLNEACPGAGLTCVCNAGFTQTVAGELCSKLKLDVSCQTTDNLCGDGAECLSDSTCTCKPDYIKNEDGITCRNPTYGEKCTAAATTCSGDNVAQTCPDGGTCACDQYRQVSGNSCVLSTLGQDCGTSATNCDPSITSVVCTGGVCACPSTLKEANGNCVEAKYNEDCSGGTNCVSPYTCNTETNKCDCTTNNVYDSAISGCRNTGAVVAAQDGALCTDMTGVSTPIDWTNTNPVYKQCDTSLTGASALTCRQCDSNATLTCNTAIADPQDSPSAAVHGNIFVVVLAMIMAVFYGV